LQSVVCSYNVYFARIAPSRRIRLHAAAVYPAVYQQNIRKTTSRSRFHGDILAHLARFGSSPAIDDARQRQLAQTACAAGRRNGMKIFALRWVPSLRTWRARSGRAAMMMGDVRRYQRYVPGMANMLAVNSAPTINDERYRVCVVFEDNGAWYPMRCSSAFSSAPGMVLIVGI